MMNTHAFNWIVLPKFANQNSPSCVCNYTRKLEISRKRIYKLAQAKQNMAHASMKLNQHEKITYPQLCLHVDRRKQY